MASIIDLHIHTTASDGTDSPAALLEKLKKTGITTFSVTDHDTMEGTLEMEKLIPAGFRFFRGIEFSCETPAGKCHILGYNFDPADPVFLAALAEGSALRRDKLETRIRSLRDTLGITLTVRERGWLDALESPGKPHFGRILVDRGISPSIDAAIRDYINPCPVLRDRIDGSTAVKAILHASGIPVWAHPLGGEGEKRLTEEKFHAQLNYLTGTGIRGLECHYSRYSAEDSAFLTDQARRHGLLISGGSDYHGAAKKDLPLGRLNQKDTPIAPSALTILDIL